MLTVVYSLFPCYYIFPNSLEYLSGLLKIVEFQFTKDQIVQKTENYSLNNREAPNRHTIPIMP